jgi:hypothetical protein
MENTNWIHPKTVTGTPAEGQTYLRRNYINEEFWREILKGNHILFTAPRRVGKTSVMKDLVANPEKGYLCIYENVESDYTSRQFYKRLYHLIINRIGTAQKSKKLFEKWIKTIGIEEISVEGNIKFKEKTIDYKDELLLLIAKLPDLNQKVVLFLDEFPEVISAIRKKEGDDPAIEVLHTIREIRHNKKFNHVTFVLAGSIGLEHVVESLDRIKLINDLHPVKIEPLNKAEATQLIRQITKGATINLKDEIIEALLSKLELLVPYFIQLMIEFCDVNLFKELRPQVEKKDIDSVFLQIFKDNSKLSDWESRLKPPYLNKEEYNFCVSLLSLIAQISVIPVQQIFNLAHKHKMTGSYMNLLKMLLRDGYLLEISEHKYRFASPLLQSWWKNQHPSFEIEK